MGQTFYVMSLENLVYLKNKLLKWADFLHVDANLGNLKVILRTIEWAW